MSRSVLLRLRGLWFSVHKWIGLCLAILIIPIVLSGALLVWHDGIDDMLNPQRHAFSAAAPALGPGAYAASAQAALGPADRLASLRYPEPGEHGPIVVSAVQPAQAEGGRPLRTMLWLDPGTARVLDKSAGNGGFMSFVHILHGSLAMPGWGRTVVGWIGLLMFVSCLTGLWLWWPLGGSVRRGFRWKRQNSLSANFHHVAGLWVLLPLAMLSFTGAWISFPALFGAFEAGRPQGGEAARRAQPLARTATSADAALAAAQRFAPGPLLGITWPTDQRRGWTIAFAGAAGPAEVTVDDATDAAAPPLSPGPETNARLMRRLHDGTGMGALWQTIIFLAGLVPALLAVTGILMWLRSRGWRAALARRRGTAAPSPQPAE